MLVHGTLHPSSLTNSIFPAIFCSAAPSPILITIFYGANDSVDEKLNKSRHVSLKRFKENLKNIVGHIRSVYSFSPRIVIIAPPPIDKDQRLSFQKKMFKEKATGVWNSKRMNWRYMCDRNVLNSIGIFH